MPLTIWSIELDPDTPDEETPVVVDAIVRIRPRQHASNGLSVRTPFAEGGGGPIRTSLRRLRVTLPASSTK